MKTNHMTLRYKLLCWLGFHHWLSVESAEHGFLASGHSMRVRVIRWADPTSSVVTLQVQRWCTGQWELVQDFPLNKYEDANEFAMKLSRSKREPVEVAAFEDGEKLESST